MSYAITMDCYKIYFDVKNSLKQYMKSQMLEFLLQPQFKDKIICLLNFTL